jgi:hypothetical protein
LVSPDPLHPPNADEGTVKTVFELFGTSFVSCTRSTDAPLTKSFPLIVNVPPPAIELEVGLTEVTAGTSANHCQLFWVMLWPHSPVSSQGTGVPLVTPGVTGTPGVKSLNVTTACSKGFAAHVAGSVVASV